MKTFSLSAVHHVCGCEVIERDVYTSEEGYHTQTKANLCEIHTLERDAYFGRDIKMTSEQRQGFIESLKDEEYRLLNEMGISEEEYLKFLARS